MANDIVKANTKWLAKMRQARFNSQQTALVMSVINENNNMMEDTYSERAYMLFMNLMGNVIIGNNLMTAEQMKDAFNECFDLYYEINKDLLDWEEVIRENEKFAGVTIDLEQIANIKASSKGAMTIKDYVPIKQRVKTIIDRQGADIDSLEDAAKAIDSPDTLVGVRSYRKMWQMIRDDLINAGIYEVNNNGDN